MENMKLNSFLIDPGKVFDVVSCRIMLEKFKKMKSFLSLIKNNTTSSGVDYGVVIFP